MGPGTSTIWAPRFDSSGDLYVTDDYSGSATSNTGQISEFSPSGQPMPAFATGLSNPFSLVFDNSGNLYVGQQGTQVEYQTTRGPPRCVH